MKLIKLQGDISKVCSKEELGNYKCGYRTIECRAIIEIIVKGLPRQQSYVVYKDKKNSDYFCIIQRKRVFLNTIGLREVHNET